MATRVPVRPKPTTSTVLPEVDRHRGQAFGPAAGTHEHVKLASSFCEREHEEKRVLGDRGGVRSPHQHQRNSAAGERGQVNGVVPDPYARHDL